MERFHVGVARRHSAAVNGEPCAVFFRSLRRREDAVHGASRQGHTGRSEVKYAQIY